ncbi:MAG: acyl-CoA dehydrogenase, partial [Rhizobiaceae bacterium]
LLKDAASAFARKGGLARSRALRQTEPGFDRGMWAQMAEQGWLGLLIDEEFGGQGLGFSEMAVVVEELARTVSPEPVTASAVYASVVLAGSDNADLKKELLGKIAAGEVIIGVAGPDRLNDAGSIGVTVKGGALSGLTGNVYPALGADGFIIAAKDGVDVAIYYVDAKATGLSVAGKTRADGTIGGVLTLKDVKASALVAKGAGAVAALRRGSDAAVIMTCAELFGTMNEALDLTLEYMRTRVQFGKAIGSYQALQHRAVDLWLQKELSMGALADAVRVLDDPKSTPDQISMVASRAKSRCGDAAHMLGRETIKLHGAIGFTDEYDVGLFLRRAMALNAWLGNPSDHRRRVSSLL